MLIFASLSLHLLIKHSSLISCTPFLPCIKPPSTSFNSFQSPHRNICFLLSIYTTCFSFPLLLLAFLYLYNARYVLSIMAPSSNYSSHQHTYGRTFSFYNSHSLAVPVGFGHHVSYWQFNSKTWKIPLPLLTLHLPRHRCGSIRVERRASRSVTELNGGKH